MFSYRLHALFFQGAPDPTVIMEHQPDIFILLTEVSYSVIHNIYIAVCAKRVFGMLFLLYKQNKKSTSRKKLCTWRVEPEDDSQIGQLL